VPGVYQVKPGNRQRLQQQVAKTLEGVKYIFVEGNKYRCTNDFSILRSQFMLTLFNFLSKVYKNRVK